MLELYTLINSQISSICTAYADHYPQELIELDGEKKYPFCEINFPYINPNNKFSDLNLLQIDIWNDKGSNITGIETITDNIDKALNRLNYNDDKMQVCIYRNNPYRLKINDSEMNIQRRQLRYIVKVYYK